MSAFHFTCDWNPEEGWAEFYFHGNRQDHQDAFTYEVGDFLQDVTGPSASPTDGRRQWAVIGGGAGQAIAFLLLVSSAAGREVHANHGGALVPAAAA